MKKLINKIRRIKRTPWSKLSTGEKVYKVITGILKKLIIIALIVAALGTVVSVGFAIIIAFGIASAVSGGLSNASRAYKPGDVYVRFWK